MDPIIPVDNCHAVGFSLLSLPTFQNLSVYHGVKAMVENYPDDDEEIIKRKFLGALYHGQNPPKLFLQKINPHIGYGLFAAETIPSEFVVGEYTGMVKKKPLLRGRRKDYVGEYTVPGYPVKYVIDAETHGSFMRYINHSERSNVSSITVILEGLLRVFIISERKISPHEQLLMDYGPDYWKGRKAPLPL